MIQNYRIFHISDLHFGPNHATTNPSGIDIAWRKGRHTSVPISEIILESLPRPRNERRRTIIICSGDLATYDQPKDFIRAYRFLRRFTVEQNIPREQILIVPGNHDVYWPEYSPTDEFAMLELFKKRFREFPNPLRKMDGPCYCFPEHQLLVYCLNSCVLCGAMQDIPGLSILLSGKSNKQIRRGKKLIKKLLRIEPGFIGHDQLRDIKSNIDSAQNRFYGIDPANVLRIAVLHHHVVPMHPELRRFASTVDAVHLKRTLASLGFHLILHGHKHIPFYCMDSTFSDGSLESLTVLSSGTMGGDPFLSAGYSFNILEVQNYASRVAKMTAVRREYDGSGQPVIMSSSRQKHSIDLPKKGRTTRDQEIASLTEALSDNLAIAFPKEMYDAQREFSDKNPIKVISYDLTYEIHLRGTISGDHHAIHTIRFLNKSNGNLHSIFLSFSGSRRIPYRNLGVSGRYRFPESRWIKIVTGTPLLDNYFKIIEFLFRGKGIPPNQSAEIQVEYDWANTGGFPDSEWGLENWMFKDGLEKFQLKCVLRNNQKILRAQAFSAYYETDHHSYEARHVENLDISRSGKVVEWVHSPERSRSIHFIRCKIGN